MSRRTTDRGRWSDRFHADPGRSLVQILAGVFAAILAFAALMVSALSWCVPDACERSMSGIGVGSLFLAAAVGGAARWISLGRLAWSRAAFVGVATALFLNGYEIVEHVLL